jgi:hypothetical protein
MTVDKTITQLPFQGGTTVVQPTLQQTFNSSTNWTVPNTVNAIWIHLVGGGAGGGGKMNTGYNASGTGGSGGNGTFGYTPVVPGSTVGIIIGAGGTGGVPSAGLVNSQSNDGGETFVNTSGTSFGAGGGVGQAYPNTTNANYADGFSGRYIGITRQQIVFGAKNASARQFVTAGLAEGVAFGGLANRNNYNSGNAPGSLPNGNNSSYGGAAGGSGTPNGGNTPQGGNGGNQITYGFTGGAGAAFANINSGGGGGGAGITGNGNAGSGAIGGNGGAGGGGGGGGGAGQANNNTNARGGNGGAGAVRIYY